MRMALLVLGCSASALAAGCGDDDAGATTAATAATAESETSAAKPMRHAKIDIASFKYLPDTITLAAGGRVTWVNRDKAPHTAENTGEPAPAQFTTGRLTRGQQKSITFSRPGSYRYHCVYHRFMEANLIVR